MDVVAVPPRALAAALRIPTGAGVEGAARERRESNDGSFACADRGTDEVLRSGGQARLLLDASSARLVRLQRLAARRLAPLLKQVLRVDNLDLARHKHATVPARARRRRRRRHSRDGRECRGWTSAAARRGTAQALAPPCEHQISLLRSSRSRGWILALVWVYRAGVQSEPDCSSPS